MTDSIYSLLSHRWSGLLVAAVVGGIGVLVLLAGRRPGRGFVRLAGWSISVGAVVLAIAAAVALTRLRRALGEHPPMGRLVDVGGYRMHILAEGDAKGGPTVIWIPGTHEAGIQLYHLHKVIRGETRSILFDRPGSGWSDPGPFPRRTGREAVELATLLDRAGERGPFILVGHSYGGLLAANFARRYPEKTAALVMADGTPPDVFTYLPDGGGPRIPAGIVHSSRVTAWRKLFGLQSDPDAQAAAADTSLARILRTIAMELADVSGPLRAISLAPDWATASIFEEWADPKGVADLVVYDAELGDLPEYLVIPAGREKPDAARALGVSAAEADRTVRFLEQARMRYLRMSSKSELIHTPAGTGHLYPYQTPEFLLDVVRRILADSAVRSGEGRHPLE